MPLILGTNSIKDTGYNVANSLRFNSGSSDSLSRTPSSASNRRTFTFSSWIKRSALTNFFSIFNGGTSGSIEYFLWWNDDTLAFSNFNAGDFIVRTNAKFRDVSAWYHLVLSVDSTQGTAANRIKIYVNGVQETSLAQSSYPSQNYDFEINNNVIQYVGHNSYNYMNGYMAETILVDGTQLAPTSFGVTNSDGVWTPIIYTGTFGTNGFNLQFEDAAALGTDSSPNGNTFTVNNLTSIDQSTDYPVVNYATMNPLDNFYQGATFSEGNIKLVTYSGAGKTAYSTSTIGVSNGKWYWEVKVNNTGNNFDTIGFAPSVPTSSDSSVLGDTTDSVGWHGYNGQLRKSNSVLATLSTYSTNDILSFALDLDNNLIYVYKNGSIQNSGTGLAITAAALTSTGIYFVAAGTNDNAAGTYEFNLGSPSFAISSSNADGNGYGNFEYAVPSGFYALNTANLAEFG